MGVSMTFVVVIVVFFFHVTLRFTYPLSYIMIRGLIFNMVSKVASKCSVITNNKKK